jgi:hypothetical protein
MNLYSPNNLSKPNSLWRTLLTWSNSTKLVGLDFHLMIPWRKQPLTFQILWTTLESIWYTINNPATKPHCTTWIQAILMILSYATEYNHCNMVRTSIYVLNHQPFQPSHPLWSPQTTVKPASYRNQAACSNQQNWRWTYHLDTNYYFIPTCP